jgi:hypothetical protein
MEQISLDLSKPKVLNGWATCKEWTLQEKQKFVKMVTSGEQTTERTEIDFHNVCDSLKMLKLGNCKQLSMNRRTWIDLSEKAKAQKYLYC